MQWTAGNADGVSLFFKNKWKSRAEEAENWVLYILLLIICFNSENGRNKEDSMFKPEEEVMVNTVFTPQFWAVVLILSESEEQLAILHVGKQLIQE